METITFLVRVEPGEDGYHVASCLSLPGCYSQGETVEEAIDNIVEAIQAYTESLAHEEAGDDASSMRLVNVPSALAVA
ncbi:MAG: type II toxin-antitoxin system HicB family antitoxin [Chloroflexi bacterium]|nr:type II toxin-antitoxin system HicB family antitoxin [Chloroflexota bacterium]